MLAEEKKQWVLNLMGYTNWKNVNNTRKDQAQLRRKVSKWAEEEKICIWREYQREIQPGKECPAQGEDLKHRLKLHAGLKKVESTLAVQMRSGKIGLAAFLHARRVPEVENALCTCGWRKQDVKHVLMFCLERQEEQKEMLKAAGTQYCNKLLTTNAGLKASSRWLMKTGLLGLYSLAREQLYSM